MSQTRPCRRCGMPIEFIEGPNAKMIPAQHIRTVYRREDNCGTPMNLVKAGFPAIEGIGPDLYVSHFETCPNASEFGKGRRLR